MEGLNLAMTCGHDDSTINIVLGIIIISIVINGRHCLVNKGLDVSDTTVHTTGLQ